MSEYDEFRVVVSPSTEGGGGWNIMLAECPLPELIGPREPIQAVMTWNQLVKLRSRHGWPDQVALEEIGSKVWESLMKNLKAEFNACLAFSDARHRGMRLVISVVGEDAEEPASGVRLQELPVEAMRSGQGFLAMNPATPVSRGIRFAPDRDALNIPLPLRILVVVAAPKDMADANAQDEKNVIQEALKSLIDVGSVELDFCQPPTRDELAHQLQTRRHHVLHFVTHGNFAQVGDDPSPLPCLMLERSDADHNSQALDASTLDGILLNSNVRLVVMTACASAAPTPDEKPYRNGALGGVARQVVESNSGVNAAIGMQFDLESKAAITFSEVFYTKLLHPGLTLDEIVGHSRQALVAKFGAGHRVWITPTVYSRCKGGRVFEVGPSRPDLSEHALQELGVIDLLLGILRTQIAQLQLSGLATPDVLSQLVPTYQTNIEQVRTRLAQLLGEFLSVSGGMASPGESISCRLALRLQVPAQIGNIQASVRFPRDQMAFVEAVSGNHTPGLPPFCQIVPEQGEIVVMLPNVSDGVVWAPGEYDLACLNFLILPEVGQPIVELLIDQASAQKNGTVAPLATLKGVLFAV